MNNYIDVDFVHLRVHSSYSLLEGAITPQDIVVLAKDNKMPAIAITDTNNLYCSLEFSKYAKASGIQPIIGICLNINFDIGNLNDLNNKIIFDKVVILAKNKTGYNNLLKLVSDANLNSVKKNCTAFVTKQELFDCKEGLILLSGGYQGPIGRMILENQMQSAEEILLSLKENFCDNFYIELTRHGIEEEITTEDGFIDLAYKHNIPIVATNDVFFSSREMFKAHDALLCIADGRFTDEKNRRSLNDEYFFKSQRQMRNLFSDIPEALANSVEIAKRCCVKSEELPPILPHFDCIHGRDEADELRFQANEGLKNRIWSYLENLSHEEQEKLKQEYQTRLDYELEVIIKMDFPGYFLIVSDFIKWSKRSNIPVGPGRGSGAGSIVAWCLEITNLDPIKFGLIFERFLNPERISMPDFDVDFCQEKRELVIKYVQNKYGYDRVAQIITFGKLQAKAVLKDVGRVLQIPYGKVDRISKMIPFNPIDPVTLSKALNMDGDLRHMQKEDPEINRLLDISLKLEGLNRHVSTHAAGIVISDRPLQELVPVYYDPKTKMPVSAYSMKYTEEAGLVKFDFLGLRTLTVIDKVCQLLKLRNIDVDINNIALDDKLTYQTLSSGDSVGVFQLESAGMRDTLRKVKPDNIEDIIAIISLYRPGPMDNIPSFIARKHGIEQPDYLHPTLEPVLKATYGVIIYQEQVIQIAQIMGGYSLGAADLLRRAMGKKIASEMDKQREIFVSGAIKNNIEKSKASFIFDLVAKFAGYGFNKSHAAAYAIISYQTAYLKAHYPVEFIAASMNLEVSDTDKINIFIREAISHNIKILPPDINKSDCYFMPETLDNGEIAIRYGLGALKAIGINSMEMMLKEREARGHFKNIFDFSSRMEIKKTLNRKQYENLIKSGAFDSLSQNRRQLFENIEIISKFGLQMATQAFTKQASLFGDEMEVMSPELKNIEDWAKAQKLNYEFDAMGFYLNDHPISEYSAILKKLKIISSVDLEKIDRGNNNYKLAGVVVSKKMRSSPRGRFANVVISDPYGIYEISIYDDNLLSDSQDLLVSGTKILLSANIRKDEGGVRITADEINSLDIIFEQYHLNFDLYLQADVEYSDIINHMQNLKTGRSKINFIIKLNNREVKITLPHSYAMDQTNISQLEKIPSVIKIVQR